MIPSKPWSRSTRYLILVIVLIFLGWFLYQSRALLGPLAISALLAFVLNPAISFVHDRSKMARALVVLLVYLVSLVVIVTASVIVVQVLTEQTTSLLAELEAMTTLLQDTYLSGTFTVFNVSINPSSLIEETAIETNNLFRADLIVEIVRSTTTNLGWILVVIITTYYLLLDWARLRDWLFGWTPNSYEGDTRRLYLEIRTVWRRYFRGQLRLSLIVGTLTATGAFIIGLPGALIFGILAAVFDVLLSVGPVIVMVIATAVALFAGSTNFELSPILFALLVLAVFGLIQIVENLWLRPRIMSSSLNIHPAIIFIAIIASLALAGVVTALVIVPVIASAAVIGKYTYFKLFEMDPWENW